MKKLVLSLCLVLFSTVWVHAQQFDLSAEIRPRFENRSGYQDMLKENEEGSAFIYQRSRLNFVYKSEPFDAKIVLQDIRTWGAVGTLGSQDRNTALHEAWAQANFFSGKLAVRVGRQEIIYDDHRIFGNVGWAQQARSHDALLIKIKPNDKHRVDVGLALNFDGGTNPAANTARLYSNVAGYKTLQYAWYHGDFSDKVNLSFLLLNTSVEKGKGAAGTTNSDSLSLRHRQTIGPRVIYKPFPELSVIGVAYLQTGQDRTKDVNALLAGIDINYQVAKTLNVGLGYEHQSGTSTLDQDNDNAENKSFNPFFGTNHKFNGLMDYFYVGNHTDNVGLDDVYLTVGYKKGKFSAKVSPHLFMSAADVYNKSGANNIKQDSYLGTEIDFVAGYKVRKDLFVNLGVSGMLASSTMEALKGKEGSKDSSNSWSWLMVTFKPQLFSFSKKSS